MSRPLVIPEPFTGEGSWDQWIFHFENIAEVNKWDAAGKLQWLKVRLADVRKLLSKGFQRKTQLITTALRSAYRSGSNHRAERNATELSCRPLRGRRMKVGQISPTD